MKIVDTIKTTYKELFTVTLLHPAFEINYTYKEPVTNIEKIITGSSLLNVLSAEPDTDTRKFFTDHLMDYRSNNNQLTCFTRAENGKPFIPIPANARIRLLLKHKNDFLYRSDLVAAGSKEVYWFSNTNNTIVNGQKHITKDATGVTASDLQEISTVGVKENCLGVIDILNSIVDVNYRLLNGDMLESPVFVIRFIEK